MILPVYFYIIIDKNIDLLKLENYQYSLLLIIHVVYGWFWGLKDILFPDHNWARPSSPISLFTIFFPVSCGLCLPMYCLGYSDQCDVFASKFYPSWFTFGSKNDETKQLILTYIGIISYIIGMIFHFGSDCQKYFILQLRAKNKMKRALITNGFFRYSRNPNYFGEILTYLGFTLVSGHLFSLSAVILIWIMMFYPNMTNKDCRMSRHKEWNAYKKMAWFCFPNVFLMVSDLRYLFVGRPEDFSEIRVGNKVE